MVDEDKPVIGYKGFDKDLKCRGFQYEVGKTYKTDRAELCECGFHFCKNPMDVFKYYPPATPELSRFAVVEALGAATKRGCDNKFVSMQLTVKNELSLLELIEASVERITSNAVHLLEEPKDGGAATSTGCGGAATSTGCGSAATSTRAKSAAINTGAKSAAINTGDGSVATNAGYGSAAIDTGDLSAATNAGYVSVAINVGCGSAAINTGADSVAANMGDLSAAINTGDESAAINTGDESIAVNTGDESIAVNTGDESIAKVSGTKSIAIVSGEGGKAAGSKGCWLVISEWGVVDGVSCRKDVRSVLVDGEVIKENVYYQLKDGEFIEVG